MACLHRLAVMILLAATARTAWSQCASPTGLDGARAYNTTTNRMQICLTPNWINFPTNGTMGSCTGNTAKLDYDTTNNVFRWCNGTNWQRSESTCAISSLTYVSKTSVDSAALNQVSAAALSADGAYMYTGGLAIARWQFSAATPPVPVKTGHVNVPSGVIQEIKVVGTTAFTVDGSGVIRSWNMSGATPSLLSTRGDAGRMGAFTNGLAISADGTKAYVVTGDEGGKSFLHIFDISNPSSIPVALYYVDTTSRTGGIARNPEIFGNYLFISFATDGAGNGGVVSYDISNPVLPVYLHTVKNTNMDNGNGLAISEDGRTAFVTPVGTTPNRVTAIDISNPAAMVIRGNYFNTQIQESYDARIIGDYAISTNVFGPACWTMVTNVSNPASLSLAASSGNCSTQGNGPGGFVVK